MATPHPPGHRNGAAVKERSELKNPGPLDAMEADMWLQPLLSLLQFRPKENGGRLPFRASLRLSKPRMTRKVFQELDVRQTTFLSRTCLQPYPRLRRQPRARSSFRSVE